MIRNFLYLDTEKVKSHSAQLFEGVTEYVSKSSGNSKEELMEQKGPVGSGRLLGDILRKEGSSTEYKFLDDFAYSLFEDKIREENLLRTINPNENFENLLGHYVEVEGRLGINETSEVVRLLSGFNDFGEAMYRVTTHQEHEAKSLGKGRSDSEIKAGAKAAGFQMDRKYSEALAHLIEFGYLDLVEAYFDVDQTTVSAPLKRDSLRESTRVLLNKYSRLSQSNIKMVGIVTQVGDNAVLDHDKKDVKDAGNLKQAMRILGVHQKSLEDTFIGQSTNDIIVDPLAIYSTILTS